MADGLRLVSGGDNIKIWEGTELKLLHSIQPHRNVTSSLVWSPNNHFLASTALGDPVVVTSFNKPTPSSIELPNCENDMCVAFHSSSRHLLTAGENEVVNLWDLKTRTIKKKIKTDSHAVSCVTFNWNDTNIALGTISGDILVHNVSTALTSTSLRLPQTQKIHGLQYSRFKRALLGSVSDDGALNIWDTNTKKIVISFPDEHTAPAMALSFSPVNDMLLATVSLDKRVIFYDILGKKVIKDIQTECPLTSVSFMQDGATFAVGTTRGKISLYDLRSGNAPLQSTVAHKSAVHCLSFQLPPKGSSSSSATLAAKLTSRSAAESTARKVTAAPLPPGGVTKQPAPEPPRTEHKQQSEVFSPLREGGLKPGEGNDNEYEPSNAKRSDHVAVSGVFSPINSTQDYRQTTKPSSDPTSVMLTNSASDDVLRVSRQPGTLSKSTSQNVERAFGPTHLSENQNTEKAALSRKISSGKQSFGSAQKKPLPPTVQPETSGLHNGHLTGSTLCNGGEMTSTSVTAGSREGMVFEALNGFLQPAMSSGETPSGFQMQFVKNLIDDSLDEFRENIHKDVMNLHVEMLRQFHIQQNEIKALLEQYSLNDALVAENERLREEIKKLKSTH